MDKKQKLQAIINELDARDAAMIADIFEKADLVTSGEPMEAPINPDKSAVYALLQLAKGAKTRHELDAATQRDKIDWEDLHSVEPQPVIELQPVQEPAKETPKEPKPKWFPYKRAWSGHKIPF